MTTPKRPSSLDKSKILPGIKSLFPPGKAFNLEEDSNFSKIIDAILAQPISDYVDFLNDVCNALNPSQCDNDVIAEWEKVVFTNDECYSPVGLSLAQRRTAVVNRLFRKDSFVPTKARLQSEMRTYMNNPTMNVEENGLFRYGVGVWGETSYNDVVIVNVTGLTDNATANRDLEQNREFLNCWLRSVLPASVAYSIAQGRPANVPAALLDWIRFSTQQIFTDYYFDGSFRF